MIPGDQWNVFVGAQLSEQRHQLLRIGKFTASKHIVELIHQLRCVQRLDLSRYLYIENQNDLVRKAPVFGDQCPGGSVTAPVEFSRPLPLAVVYADAISAQMWKLLGRLIILVRIEEPQLSPQSQHAPQRRDRQLNRLNDGRLFTLPFERNFAAAERIMLNHDVVHDELRLREFVRISRWIRRLLVFFASWLRRALFLRTIVSFGLVLSGRESSNRQD